MITIKKNIDMDIDYLRSQYTHLDEVLFFDIETTGFSYRKNMVYLIGCAYVEDGQGYLVQWLAEEDHDEYTLLFHFITLSKSFKTLVHYNGSTFDIPFIRKKAKLYDLIFESEDFVHQDLYKLIRPTKHILGLTDCKLKTVEKHLGLQRHDPYTGGELIDQYLTYMTSRNEDIRQALFLHNADDLIGLVAITKILESLRYYKLLRETYDSYTIIHSHVKDSTLIIELSLDTPVPFTYTCEKDLHGIYLADGKVRLHIKLVEDELKYYFDNYKDYYYVPSEDQAMHKQVAKYIDSSNRVRATRDNCYIKKRGTFIPLIHTTSFMDSHVFYKLRKDQIAYIQLDHKMLSQDEWLKRLAHVFLRHL